MSHSVVIGDQDEGGYCTTGRFQKKTHVVISFMVRKMMKGVKQNALEEKTHCQQKETSEDGWLDKGSSIAVVSLTDADFSLKLHNS